MAELRRDSPPEPSIRLERHGHLPRLADPWYQGPAFVHWSMTARNRATGWLDEPTHLRLREILVHTGARFGLFCPLYCLMLDHVHLLWVGLHKDSDQRRAAAFFRTQSAAPLPRGAGLNWQREGYDHVLRETERACGAFAATARYILENPVRAGLCRTASDWPYSGCVVAGYPSLSPHEAGYWPKFWRIHEAARTA